MGELFTSGRILDGILVLVALETLLLWLLRRRFGRGPDFADIAPTLTAGALLLLALRAAVGGLWWGWIAAPLTLALVAHIIDLARRWRGPRG
jgi:hypothetical protein